MAEGEAERRGLSEGVRRGRHPLRADADAAGGASQEDRVLIASRIGRSYAKIDVSGLGWALGSVVEHRLHTAGVSGSNPLAPTNLRPPERFARRRAWVGFANLLE